MSSRERRQRCPSLSAWRNVLPLFFANEALQRRDTARRILGAAGGANKRIHLTTPAMCSMPLVIRHSARTSTPRLPSDRNLKWSRGGQDWSFRIGLSVKNRKQG